MTRREQLLAAITALAMLPVLVVGWPVLAFDDWQMRNRRGRYDRRGHYR